MISDFRVSIFLRTPLGCGVSRHNVIGICLLKLTKCTSWFNLSSSGFVNTAIGNERERFRWNTQHRKNSSLMSSLFVRLKRKKSSGYTLLKEQNFKQINQNEPRTHVPLENQTTHKCWKRMPIFIKFKALKPDVPKEKRLNSAVVGDKLF